MRRKLEPPARLLDPTRLDRYRVAARALRSTIVDPLLRSGPPPVAAGGGPLLFSSFSFFFSSLLGPPVNIPLLVDFVVVTQ